MVSRRILRIRVGYITPSASLIEPLIRTLIRTSLIASFIVIKVICERLNSISCNFNRKYALTYFWLLVVFVLFDAQFSVFGKNKIWFSDLLFDAVWYFSGFSSEYAPHRSQPFARLLGMRESRDSRDRSQNMTPKGL